MTGARDAFSADLDGDGDYDALCTSYDDDKIAWYENDGNGGFGAQQVITTNADLAYSVYAADLDGDGDYDVLSASGNDDKVAWYENDGSGNFGAQQIVSDAADIATSVYAADLDGDGDQDVLSASWNDNTIACYVNDGSGNFGAQQVITTSALGAQSVHAADFDGDGDQDVLSASSGDDKIAWYENNSDVSLTPPITVVFPNGGEEIGDAAIVTWESAAVEFVDIEYSTNGGSTWTTIASNVSAAWGSYPWTTPGGAGTSDAKVRVSDASNGSVNDASDATFTLLGPTVTLLTPNGGEMWEIGSVQIIRWTSDFVANVWIDYSTNGGGVWKKIVNLPATDTGYAWTVPAEATNEALVRVRDASDGTIDPSDAHFRIVDPLFGDEQIVTTAADYATSVHRADLDGDGDFDVLSASSSDDKIAWYKNYGGGSFSPQQVIATSADGPTDVFAADLDGDGDQDVLSASSSDDKIAWYENDGGGNFSAQQIITTNADAARSVFAADLDGDGDYDVLSASLTDDKIAWYENDGAGSFGAQQVITTDADAAYSVYAADIDGDGDQDVLSASSGDDKIAWYVNDGNENFGAQQVITTDADYATSVCAADLDGDGDKDVLSASRDDDKIAWYENDGSGTFLAYPAINANADWARSVYAADLDGDGDQDVLSASSADDKIAWYENVSDAPLTPPITVTTPNGGESVFGTALVTWRSAAVDFVDLEYSTNGGSSWTTFASNVSAAWGSYPWTVPNVGTSDALVRVSDASNPSVSDQSDAAFAILAKSLTVTSPNGGEAWEIGSERSVSWTSEFVDSVLIEYSSDNGGAWEEIATVAASDNFYVWTLPTEPTTQALARLTDVSDPSVSDQSDATFTVFEKSLTLLSPDGGEMWEIGSEQTVQWTSQNISQVKVAYSVDSGTTWTHLRTVAAADAAYSWTLPTEASTGVLARVTDNANATVFDQSDSTFTIYARGVTLLSPTAARCGKSEPSEVSAGRALTSTASKSLTRPMTAAPGPKWRPSRRPTLPTRGRSRLKPQN
ncbi:MAG: hypothetical protein GF419_10555, partial [Ignavibacteriales bacterium]|nr:hypothetical protein [Ignavibacteriales bacterium]